MGLAVAQHAVDHAEADHGFAVRNEFFVVLTQAAVPIQPAERPLHDPALRLDIKAVGVIAPFYNLQQPPAGLLDPVNELSGVASVGPDDPESGEFSGHDI